MTDVEELARVAIDCGFHLHRSLGPGLLESVYETVLARAIERRGLQVSRQHPVVFRYDGMTFEDGLRIDLLVEHRLVIELKSVERLAPVHGKQVLTYLRLMEQPLGLLMNFGAETFRDGLKRVVNNHLAPAASPLRIHAHAPQA